MNDLYEWQQYFRKRSNRTEDRDNTADLPVVNLEENNQFQGNFRARTEYIPKALQNSVNPDKLTAFCEKLGAVISDNNVAMILFDDMIWEINLKTGNVSLKSRTMEERVASVCLEWDSNARFPGYSDTFTQKEMLILSKVVAILTDRLPEDVKCSVESFLKDGKKRTYVSPRSLYRSSSRPSSRSFSNIFKLLLCGSQNAKPDECIRAYIPSYFTQDYKTIIGCNFYTKLVRLCENQLVKLSIWSLASQKRFDFLRPNYYDGASGAIVVFNYFNNESWLMAKRQIEELLQLYPALPILVVGNKRQTTSEVNCLLDTEDVSEYIEEYNLLYHVSSEPVEQNFEETLRLLVNQMVGRL